MKKVLVQIYSPEYTEMKGIMASKIRYPYPSVSIKRDPDNIKVNTLSAAEVVAG